MGKDRKLHAVADLDDEIELDLDAYIDGLTEDERELDPIVGPGGTAVLNGGRINEAGHWVGP